MLTTWQRGARLGLATLVIIGAVTGCATSQRQTGSAGSMGSSGAHPAASADPNAAKITALLRSAAQADGESAPSQVQWVYASRSAVAGTLKFGIPAGEASVSDVLVIAHGQFTASLAPVPPGASAPTGTVLAVVINSQTWQATDVSLLKQAPTLSKIGTVRTH